MTHLPYAFIKHQAFISVITQNRNQTYQQLLNNIRDILKSKYSQKPQLAASHPIVCQNLHGLFDGG